MSNHSDESTTFAGVAIVIIVVGALLIKFMTGIFLSLGKLFDAVGEMAQSFLGMIWWSVLLIALIFAGACAVYGAFYFIRRFLKLVEEGTDVQRSFALKSVELTQFVETSAQNIYREMDQRLRKMENELKQALKEPSISPEVVAAAKPAAAPAIAEPEKTNPDAIQSDAALLDGAPQAMSPF